MYFAILLFIAILYYTVIGLPFIYLFLNGRSFANTNDQKKLITLCLSPIFSYAFFLFLVFESSYLFGVGSRSVVYPIFILLNLVSIVFYSVFFQKSKISVLFNKKTILFYFWVLLISYFSAVHLIFPVITGKWEMAYATGDDAARWYMFVEYFKDNSWVWGEKTKVLITTIRERGMYAFSGSIISLLFWAKNSFAYSANHAISQILAFFSMCVFIIGFYRDEEINTKEFVLSSVLVAIFAGFFGAQIHVYYQGYATHYYSTYAIFAGFCYLAFLRLEQKRKIYLWIGVWAVFVSLIYTHRYGVLFLAIAFAIEFLNQFFIQRKEQSIKVKSLIELTSYFILFFIIITIFCWGELGVNFGQLNLSSLIHNKNSISDGSLKKFIMGFLLQKTSNYYSAAETNWWEYLVTLFGILSKYQPVGFYEKLSLVGLGISWMLGFIIYGFDRRKEVLNLLILIVLSIFLSLALYKINLTYLLYKYILYLPYFFSVLISYYISRFIFSLNKIKLIAVTPLVVAYLFSAVSEYSINMNFYSGLITSRLTKVDDNFKNLKLSIDSYFEKCSDCGTKIIYGHDTSPERHLLLRQYLNTYEYYPAQVYDTGFLYDMVITDQQKLINHTFDGLLYVNEIGYCDIFNFDEQKENLLYEKTPFKFLKKNSSIVEFTDGFYYTTSYARSNSGCFLPFLRMATGSGLLKLVNGHKFNQLQMFIKLPENIALPDVLKITLNSAQVNISKTDQAGSNWVAEINGISDIYLSEIEIKKIVPDVPVEITFFKWK